MTDTIPERVLYGLAALLGVAVTYSVYDQCAGHNGAPTQSLDASAMPVPKRVMVDALEVDALFTTPLDSSFMSALHEPLRLALSMNRAKAQKLANYCSKLQEPYMRLLRGERQPGLVADVISMRRIIKRLLADLEIDARLSGFTTALQELDEDLRRLNKMLDGFVHNASLQSDLNILTRSSLPMPQAR